MSVAAIQWAFEQQVAQPSMKLVLLAFANYADENGHCYPSKKRLLRDTSLSINTLKAVLRRLRDDGYISDTGDRRGRTSQIIVYRLCTERGPNKAPLGSDRGTKLTPLKGARVDPLEAERGPILDSKGGQKLYPRTVKEPSVDAAAATREVADRVSELAKACPVKSPGWMTAQSVVTVWLQRGADPELDIYPTVSRLMAGRAAKGHDPPSSPNYFSKAVDEARVERIQALNAPEPEPHNASRQGNGTRAARPASNLPAYITALNRGSG